MRCSLLPFKARNHIPHLPTGRCLQREQALTVLAAVQAKEKYIAVD